MIGGPELLLDRLADAPAVREYLGSFGCICEREEFDVGVYWSFRGAGLALRVDLAGVIKSVFLYAAGHEGYARYTGLMPLGLRMDLTKWAVRDHLGRPAFEAGPREIAGLGRKGPMERYDLSEFSVHFEYAEPRGEILVATLMTPDAVPNRQVSN